MVINDSCTCCTVVWCYPPAIPRVLGADGLDAGKLLIPDSVYQTLYAHADLIMYYGIHSIRQGILYILLAPRY